MTRRAGTGLILALLGAAAGGCSSETIVLASVAPVEDAGAPHPLRRCVANSDCLPGAFCARHDCADRAGMCEPFPVYCPPDERPVCGCNGVTYFNDCLRRAAGVAPAHPDECGVDALTCGGADPAACPTGASCALLLGIGDPAACGALGGACWVVPAACSPTAATASPDRWDECDADGGRCVDTCIAIRSGRPHVRAVMCSN